VASLPSRHEHPHGAWLAPERPRIFAALEIRPDHNGGLGVFAGAPIAAGAVVAVDGGVVLESIADLPAGKRYAVMIGEDLFLAPRDYDELEAVWYFNHSCHSNLARLGGLVYSAKRGIRAGEELTLDYACLVAGFPDWRMACSCGAEGCRHEITSEDWRRPELARALWPEWLPHVQRRILGAGIDPFDG
jgi:hypothetical protein